MKELQVSGISACLDGWEVLRDVAFSIDKGECCCLLGPSGCGKTTLLRIVAGLERADTGKIFFRGKRMEKVPCHKRNFGLMFQDFALFPHRNVFQNVSFGLEMKGAGRAEMKQRVEAMLDLVGLSGYQGRGVDELSGGERQRVALARTLVVEPDLLMLDEPLASLDRRLRDRLLEDVRCIIHKVGVTTIFVTHDQHEAFRVADTVCVMDSGVIEQVGKPEEIYNRPANRTVAGFLGFRNLLPAAGGPDGVATDCGRFENLPEKTGASNADDLLILPDAARLISKETFEKSTVNVLEAKVVDAAFKGSINTLAVEACGGHILYFDMFKSRPPADVGSIVYLWVNPDRMRLI